jgi:hypothetical protein
MPDPVVDFGPVRTPDGLPARHRGVSDASLSVAERLWIDTPVVTGAYA